jgi:hypothetical protein
MHHKIIQLAGLPLAVDYGTVPDWIAGLGTAFATIVAVLVLNREVQARREATAAELDRQAQTVLCWLEVQRSGPPVAQTFGGIFPQPTGGHLMLVIRVGGDEPIFDCQGQLDLPQPSAGSVQLQAHAQEWEDLGFHVADSHTLTFQEHVLAPGVHRRALALPASIRQESSALLLFTDAPGQRWSRSTSGELTKIATRSRLPAGAVRVGPGTLWHGRRSTK